MEDLLYFEQLETLEQNDAKIFLQSIKVFKSLSQESLSILISHLRKLKFTQSRVLFQQNDQAQKFAYILHSGEVFVNLSSLSTKIKPFFIYRIGRLFRCGRAFDKSIVQTEKHQYQLDIDLAQFQAGTIVGLEQVYWDESLDRMYSAYVTKDSELYAISYEDLKFFLNLEINETFNLQLKQYIQVRLKFLQKRGRNMKQALDTNETDLQDSQFIREQVSVIDLFIKNLYPQSLQDKIYEKLAPIAEDRLVRSIGVNFEQRKLSQNEVSVLLNYQIQEMILQRGQSHKLLARMDLEERAQKHKLHQTGNVNYDGVFGNHIKEHWNGIKNFKKQLAIDDPHFKSQLAQIGKNKKRKKIIKNILDKAELPQTKPRIEFDKDLIIRQQDTMQSIIEDQEFFTFQQNFLLKNQRMKPNLPEDECDTFHITNPQAWIVNDYLNSRKNQEKPIDVSREQPRNQSKNTSVSQNQRFSRIQRQVESLHFHTRSNNDLSIQRINRDFDITPRQPFSLPPIKKRLNYQSLSIAEKIKVLQSNQHFHSVSLNQRLNTLE